MLHKQSRSAGVSPLPARQVATAHPPVSRLSQRTCHTTRSICRLVCRAATAAAAAGIRPLPADALLPGVGPRLLVPREGGLWSKSEYPAGPVPSGYHPGKKLNVHSVRDNKRKLVDACKEAGLVGYLHLFLAMAMQETTHLDVQQRDDTKDGPAGSEWTKPSANLTIFNMNVDFVEYTGFYAARIGKDKWNFLNSGSQASFKEAMQILAKAFQDPRFAHNTRSGIKGVLNFHRQGRSGWLAFNEAGMDSRNKDMKLFHSAIYTHMRYIEADPSLETDNRRVNVDVSHINDQTF